MLVRVDRNVKPPVCNISAELSIDDVYVGQLWMFDILSSQCDLTGSVFPWLQLEDF